MTNQSAEIEKRIEMVLRTKYPLEPLDNMDLQVIKGTTQELAELFTNLSESRAIAELENQLAIHKFTRDARVFRRDIEASIRILKEAR